VKELSCVTDERALPESVVQDLVAFGSCHDVRRSDAIVVSDDVF